MTKKPQVTIEMESGNSIKVELYPEVAPKRSLILLHWPGRGFMTG